MSQINICDTSVVGPKHDAGAIALQQTMCIVGIGNPVRCDDAVGLLVVRLLKERLQETAAQWERTVHISELYAWSWDLLDEITGFESALIIDSVISGNGIPGQCFIFDAANLDTINNGVFVNSHGFNLASLIAAGRRLGYRLPKNIAVLAVEIEDNVSFSEVPTEKVNKRIGEIAEKVLGMTTESTG